ncbi:MAG: 50S ribosomal protein L6 [Lentisphaeria bacterium]|nr:50S ribosomal protein L6 [Lentisphaeria bacterium]MDD6336984.1 50S ribosomal protein L6 [Lentisphaeria bacterium]
MSRIGKKPVVIPAGVTVKVEDGATVVTGKLGTLSIPTQKHITVAVEGDQVVLSRDTDLDNAKAMHGLNRALIQNAVIGVSKGYSKSLEIVGVGFRADLAGNKLTLKVGYSHDINYTVPEGIKMTVADGYKITVEGFDKQLVGAVASTIRAFRKPEPYKGKGVRYSDEQVTIKPGKKNA